MYAHIEKFMYRFTLAVLLGLFIHQVHAQTLAVEKDAPLTVGALASIHQSAYHVDDKITAVPLLLYDNNRFYLEGTDAGFYPYKIRIINIGYVQVLVMTDNTIIQKMQKQRLYKV